MSEMCGQRYSHQNNVSKRDVTRCRCLMMAGITPDSAGGTRGSNQAAHLRYDMATSLYCFACGREATLSHTALRSPTSPTLASRECLAR